VLLQLQLHLEVEGDFNFNFNFIDKVSWKTLLQVCTAH